MARGFHPCPTSQADLNTLLTSGGLDRTMQTTTMTCMLVLQGTTHNDNDATPKNIQTLSGGKFLCLSLLAC